MQYYTASEAAKRLGIHEKTVRRYIEKGKLTSHSPARNRLAIPEDEIEQLAQELSQYAPVRTQVDMSELMARLTELEQEVHDLRSKQDEMQTMIARLQEQRQTPHPSFDFPIPEPKTPKQRETPAHSMAAADDLPVGSISYDIFAAMHGVNARTFRGHITTGILGPHGREYVKAIERPKASRPREKERYLTPEQQVQARAFWQRFGIRFTPPGAATDENMET